MTRSDETGPPAVRAEPPNFRLRRHGLRLLVDDTATEFGTTYLQDSCGYDEAAAHADRVAACWAAAEGIATEALTPGLIADLIVICEAVRPLLRLLDAEMNAPAEPAASAITNARAEGGSS
jgi:hypothetical protein